MADRTSPTKPIEGRVAMVLNARELAINVGTKRGVTVGMKFKVLADKPTDIFDPETEEPLGTLDREKVRVQVVETQARLSVCRTYRKKYIGGSSTYAAVAALEALTAPPRVVHETLKADAEFPPPLSETESYVRKGDRVVQLLGDDD